MEKDSHDLTFINELNIDINERCEICYELGTYIILNDLCGHNFCVKCLKSYYEYCLTENILYPIECPDEGCKAEIFKVYKYLISKEEYSRIKSIRKIRKKLGDRNVVWCDVPDCSGYYFVQNYTNKKCLICKSKVKKRRNFEREIIERDCNVVKCPACKAFISKDLMCMFARCYCGARFCLKCKGPIENHDSFCMLKKSSGKIWYSVVIIFLYSFILFPWFPAVGIMIYHYNWNKIRYYRCFKYRKIWICAVFVLSPLLFPVFIFYFTFWGSSSCVNCLFEYKKLNLALKCISFLLKFLTIPILFLGVILFTLLAIILSPCLGIYLLVLLINQPRTRTEH